MGRFLRENYIFTLLVSRLEIETQLETQLTLRMSIGQAETDTTHVQKAWQLIGDAVKGEIH